MKSASSSYLHEAMAMSGQYFKSRKKFPFCYGAAGHLEKELVSQHRFMSWGTGSANQLITTESSFAAEGERWLNGIELFFAPRFAMRFHQRS